MNIRDWLILGAVALAAAISFVRLIKRGTSCSGNCASCSRSGGSACSCGRK